MHSSLLLKSCLETGDVSENHCSTSGMLSQGKMIPENIMVGIVSPIPQISIAVFWLEEMTDTRIPIAREATTNTRAASESNARLPLTGTSIT